MFAHTVSSGTGAGVANRVRFLSNEVWGTKVAEGAAREQRSSGDSVLEKSGSKSGNKGLVDESEVVVQQGEEMGGTVGGAGGGADAREEVVVGAGVLDEVGTGTAEQVRESGGAAQQADADLLSSDEKYHDTKNSMSVDEAQGGVVAVVGTKNLEQNLFGPAVGVSSGAGEDSPGPASEQSVIPEQSSKINEQKFAPPKRDREQRRFDEFPAKPEDLPSRGAASTSQPDKTPGSGLGPRRKRGRASARSDADDVIEEEKTPRGTSLPLTRMPRLPNVEHASPQRARASPPRDVTRRSGSHSPSIVRSAAKGAAKASAEQESKNKQFLIYEIRRLGAGPLRDTQRESSSADTAVSALDGRSLKSAATLYCKLVDDVLGKISFVDVVKPGDAGGTTSTDPLQRAGSGQRTQSASSHDDSIGNAAADGAPSVGRTAPASRISPPKTAEQAQSSGESISVQAAREQVDQQEAALRLLVDSGRNVRRSDFFLQNSAELHYYLRNKPSAEYCVGDLAGSAHGGEDTPLQPQAETAQLLAFYLKFFMRKSAELLGAVDIDLMSTAPRKIPYLAKYRLRDFACELFKDQMKFRGQIRMSAVRWQIKTLRSSRREREIPSCGLIVQSQFYYTRI